MEKHFILWADDDPDDMAMFRNIVGQVTDRAHVFSANDGREVLGCLNMMRKERFFPCLVILDMNMPALGGRETIDLMKQDNDFSSIPIVVFTTSDRQVDRNFCDRFGVPLFTKPHSIDDLKTSIAQLLHMCSCHQRKASAPARPSV